MTRTHYLSFVAIGLWSSVVAAAAPPETIEPQTPPRGAADAESLRKQRDESIDVMRERAAATKVQVAGDGERQTAKLNQTPLLYFTNEPHRIVGGSLWGWSVAGRPVAICKVEQYDRGRPDQTWLYCLASLAEKKIDVDWRDGEAWSAKTPGIEMRDIPDAPAAAENARGRLRQLKDLARRFAANDFEPKGPGTTQLRLLPQPLWRYSAADAGIVDGAVFATEGVATVYMIELQAGAGKAPRWRYGLTAMSAWEVSIHLDDKEVWKKPFTAGPAPYENWIFRWERPVASNK